MARVCEDGRQDIAFDGPVRPVLLDDVTLPIIVTPGVSFDIAVRKLHKEKLGQHGVLHYQCDDSCTLYRGQGYIQMPGMH